MTRRLVEILLFFSVFFCLSVPSRAQEIQPGDTIVVCGYDNTFLASANTIGKKGPVANFKKHLVSLDISNQVVVIEEKYNAIQFRVRIGNTQYLLSVGNPKAKKSEGKESVLYYIHKSFADSLRAFYLGQPFYRRNGETLRYEEIIFGTKIEIRQKDWANVFYSGGRPSIITYDPGQLSADGRTSDYSREFHNEMGTRNESALVVERDARWSPDLIASMRTKYVGDTLVLGHNLYEIKDSIDVFRPANKNFPASVLKGCIKYSKVRVLS